MLPARMRRGLRRVMRRRGVRSDRSQFPLSIEGSKGQLDYKLPAKVRRGLRQVKRRNGSCGAAIFSRGGEAPTFKLATTKITARRPHCCGRGCCTGEIVWRVSARGGLRPYGTKHINGEFKGKRQRMAPVKGAATKANQRQYGARSGRRVAIPFWGSRRSAGVDD